MPKIYKQKCKTCGGYYEGVGKFYCSVKCCHNDKDWIKTQKIIHKGKHYSLRTEFKKGFHPLTEFKKGERPPLKTEFKKGRVPWNKGISMLKETKEKLRKAHLGMFLAEKHWNWKGGITPENIKIRRNIESRLWRESVFIRDNWTCQKCGEKGGKLNPHHIQNFSQFPELRFAIDNGITFCVSCHKEFHKLFSRQNNPKEQIIKFLK